MTLRELACKLFGHRYRGVANYGTVKYRCTRCLRYWP